MTQYREGAPVSGQAPQPPLVKPPDVPPLIGAPLCQHCDNNFEPNFLGQRFCSRGCAVRYRLGVERTGQLTKVDVERIRECYLGGARQVDLAARFGISQTHVSGIVRGEKWK